MSPISPADTTFVPRREFIRDQRPASAFSILALSGAALPTDTILALRKHLESIHVILGSRELPHDNFLELALDGKPWSSPKSMRSEKLLIEIIDVIHIMGHKFLTTMDYGREQDDRIIMSFSRTFPSPLSNPAPPPPFHGMSNDSLSVVPHPVKLLFAISFISQSHLRVIAPPLHLTPAILQTVRGSWPRGVVSEKKAADNVYEFKLKGYKCNVIYSSIDLNDLTHNPPMCSVPRGYLRHGFPSSYSLVARHLGWLRLLAPHLTLTQ